MYLLIHAIVDICVESIELGRVELSEGSLDLGKETASRIPTKGIIVGLEVGKDGLHHLLEGGRHLDGLFSEGTQKIASDRQVKLPIILLRRASLRVARWSGLSQVVQIGPMGCATNRGPA